MIAIPKIFKKKIRNIVSCLLLNNDQGLVILFESINDQPINFIDRQVFLYSDGFNQIVEDLDKTLYELEQKGDFKIDETIFFVPSDWVESGSEKIKSHYSSVIKNIIKNNQLKSLGYVPLEQMDYDDDQLIDNIADVIAEKYNFNVTDVPIESTVDGFVIGKDIKKETDINDQSEDVIEKKKPSAFLLIGLKSMVNRLLNRFRGNSRLLIISAVIATLLLIVGLYFLIASYRLHLVIYYHKKTIDKTLEIEKSLALKTDSIVITESLKIATTGKTEIGEKAVGSVVVYNLTDKEVTFRKGMLLSDGSGHKFVFDGEVKVASSSKEIATDQMLTTFGKTKANLTAISIGPEFNINKDKKLILDNVAESDAYATTDVKFSGGSKKTVSSVSKTDLADIKEKLLEKITKNSSDKIKISKGYKIIDALTDIKTESIRYSAEIDEQASSLTATIKANVSYYSYRQQDLKEEIINRIESSVPDNYRLSSENISYKITQADKVKEAVTLSLTVKAPLIYQINQQELIDKFTGKSLSQLDQYLKSDKKLAGYDLQPTNNWIFLSGRVPFLKKNITIDVKQL